MKRGIIGSVISIASMFTNLDAQSEFPLGIYLFGQRNVNAVQISTDLKATWIQTVTTNRNESRYVTLINDASNAGLKVIAQDVPALSDMARGQHMEYEAEQVVEVMKNYFQGNQTGATEGNYRVARIGDAPGYLVKDPRPNFQWNYYPDVSLYKVRFIVKVDAGVFANTEEVVTIEIACNDLNHQPFIVDPVTKTYGDFVPGEWLNIDVEFNRSIPIAPPPEERFLRGDVPPPDPTDIHTCEDIDIRIYWHGHVTTYLDKMIVEDGVGKDLHANQHTQDIQDAARALDSFSNVMRLYLWDEPYVSSFASHKYVKDQIAAVISTSGNPGGKSSVTSALAYEYTRFVSYADPNELLMDNYPIRSNIPSPVYKNNPPDVGAGSSDLGIADYTTDEAYTITLQQTIDSKLIYDVVHNIGLKPIAEVSGNRSFWFIPQLHGEYIVDTGKFRHPLDYTPNPDGQSCRPPTGNEIRMMINLAVAYGAKGIIAYPFGTDVLDNWGGADYAFVTGLVKYEPSGTTAMDHSANVTVMPPAIQAFQGRRSKFGLAIVKNGMLSRACMISLKS